jgi:diguanylate cyclase (GGDEF)-like protein
VLTDLIVWVAARAASLLLTHPTSTLLSQNGLPDPTDCKLDPIHLFRLLFEQAEKAIFLADGQTGAILALNPRAMQLVGRLHCGQGSGQSFSDWLQRPIWQLHPDDLQAELQAQVETSLAAGSHLTGWNELLTAEGQRIAVELNGSPLMLANQHLYCYVLEAAPIASFSAAGSSDPDDNGRGHPSELQQLRAQLQQEQAQRQQLETALQRMGQQLTEVLNGTGDGLIELDHSLCIQSINSAAAQCFDQEIVTLLGRPLPEALPWGCGFQRTSDYQQLLENHSAACFETACQQEGCPNRYEACAFPTAHGLSIFFRNLPDRQSVERILTEHVQTRTEELRLANEALAQQIREREASEQRERAYNAILKQLVRGETSLEDMLEQIVYTLEQQLPGSLGSVLLLDEPGETLCTCAAPHLPGFYNRFTQEVKIGDGVGSCGTAAYRRERVIVEDISMHPYWADYREVAARAGLRAAWSEPIRTASGGILGILTVYYRQPATPTASQLQLIEAIANLLSLVIERKRTEDSLAQSEGRHRAMLQAIPDLMFRLSADGRYLDYHAPDPSLLLVPPAAFLNQPVAAIMPPAMAELILHHLRQALLLREVQVFETEFVLPNGRQVFFENRLMALNTNEALTIVRDITDNRQTEARLRLQNQKLELIRQLNEDLQSCQTLEEACRVVQLAAPNLFVGYTGSLALYQPEDHTLEVVAQWGDGRINKMLFSPQECWGLRRGSLHEVSDPCCSLHCNHLLAIPAAGYCCLPLVVQGDTLGLLQLNRQVANAELLPVSQTLKAVGETIKLAFSNLRLRERLRQQAIRDPLTGLFNRGYLEETLGREVQRCQRSHSPLCVAMLDIDHFKQLNDCHGHEAGDLVLRKLGSLLRQHLRASDIVCRYGGEEFAFVLPEASLATAYRRLTDLAEMIRDLQLAYRGETLNPVTVSIGLAILPEHGTSPADLLHAADMALYAAKRAGRNRLVVWWGEACGRSPAGHWPSPLPPGNEPATSQVH